MTYPIVVTMSGPERARAKVELAFEKANLTVIPSTEWPIHRESYYAEHWPHMEPIKLVWQHDPTDKTPEDDPAYNPKRGSYVAPEGIDPDEDHGFIAVLAENKAQFDVSHALVEKHGWVLRTHHELPEKPEPDPLTEYIEHLERRLTAIEAQSPHPPMMGGALEASAGFAMQGGSYAANQTRRAVFGSFARTSANTPGLLSGGLLSPTDMQLSNAVSGLVVNISVGECIVPGNETTSQGGYYVFNSSQSSVTLATANASNPRIDLVCLTSADAQYTIPSGGTSGSVTIQAVTGTPSSGANLTNLTGAPTLPGSSLLLGYVLVPAAAMNLTGGDIGNRAGVVGLQLQIAGQLLARKFYAPGSEVVPSISSGTVGSSPSQAIDPTNLTLSFVAPASGAVIVEFQAFASSTASNFQVWYPTLHGTATVQGNAQIAIEANSAGALNLNASTSHLVTGLTPGTTYQFDWSATSSATSSGSLGIGPGNSTHSYGPAIMLISAA